MLNMNESLIDVMFDKLIYNIRVSSSGDVVDFKMYMPGSKSALQLRLRKNTVKKFKVWFDKIYSEIFDESN